MINPSMESSSNSGTGSSSMESSAGGASMEAPRNEAMAVKEGLDIAPSANGTELADISRYATTEDLELPPMPNISNYDIRPISGSISSPRGNTRSSGLGLMEDLARLAEAGGSGIIPPEATSKKSPANASPSSNNASPRELYPSSLPPAEQQRKLEEGVETTNELPEGEIQETLPEKNEGLKAEVSDGAEEDRVDSNIEGEQEEAEKPQETETPEEKVETESEVGEKAETETETKETKKSIPTAEKFEAKNLYERLGVDPNASTEEIRQAYRKLAREYHPDVNQGEDTTELFQILKETENILTDPERRIAYDEAHAEFKNMGQERYDNARTGRGYGKESAKNYEDKQSWWRTRREGAVYNHDFSNDSGEYSQNGRFYGAFAEGYKAVYYDGSYYGVGPDGMAFTAPYRLILKISPESFSAVIDRDGLMYLLNKRLEIISAPYEKLRMEGDVLIGVSEGLEYVVDPDTGHEISAGFQSLKWYEGVGLAGQLPGGQVLVNPETGLIVRRLAAIDFLSKKRAERQEQES